MDLFRQDEEQIINALKAEINNWRARWAPTLSFNSQLIALLTEMLSLLRAQEHKADAPAFDYDPEPRSDARTDRDQEAKSGSSNAARDDRGIDMAEMGRAADREVQARRLPRSPEEAEIRIGDDAHSAHDAHTVRKK
jgi:hypothetical protein